MPIFNWARTFSFEPRSVARPADEAGVVRVVKEAAAAGARVKVVGALHSWSEAARADEVALDLGALCGVVEVDRQRGRARVRAGTRLSDLVHALAAEGLALPVLGSVTAQTLAGATSTGTHGSSLQVGNLAAAVVGARIVDGRGEVHALDEHDPRLPGVRLAVGSLGVLTELVLQLVPLYRLRESTRVLPFEEAVDALPEAIATHRYAKLWWIPHTPKAMIFTQDLTDEPGEPSAALAWVDRVLLNRGAFRAVLALGRAVDAWIPPLNRLVAAAYFQERTRVGRYDRILPLEMPPRHHETEWAIPATRAGEGLRALRALVDRLGVHVNFIVEARFVKGDDAWLSPTGGADACHIGGYTATPRGQDAWFGGVAEAMRALGGRPHWGKVHELDEAALRAAYPRLDEFRALGDALDPAGVFLNPFAARLRGRSLP